RSNSPNAPDPLVLSTYYLGPSRGGRADITTRLIREGRSSSTFAVDIAQNDAPKITALATMGSLDSLPEDVETTAVPPVLPEPDQCISIAEAPGDFIESAPLVKRYDMRLDPDTAGFAVGRPSGRGLLQGWIRLADGTEPDALSLLAFLDAFPPVMFDLGRFNWAPTMELTAHLRAAPAPGWIKAKLYTRNIAGGMFEEDCELWDSAGRLVAQSRQLARQPRG
ncbi:MAG: thioesterase family protein, partial [Brevibacterium sp.]|nr:thioesterase family protein [Brevibacterium sp.]